MRRAPEQQREVKSFGNQITVPVRERNIDLDRPMLSHETHHHAREEASAHFRRGNQPDQTAKLALSLRHSVLRFCKLGERARGEMVIRPAVGGELRSAAPALEESCAEPFFQLRYRAAYRSLRQSKPAGSSGKALAFHDPSKSAREVQIH